MDTINAGYQRILEIIEHLRHLEDTENPAH